MGEMAEATLGGLFCQCCGEVFDDFDEPGYPRTCVSCGGDERPQRPRSNKKRPEKTIQCGGCKKWFATPFALKQHRAMKDH
jgi:hypothetical protein